MTPEETLIIVMLNTITNKELMVKVNKNLRDGMAWMDVRNIIVKLDRAAHLSDQYRNTNRMHASAAQNKSCRACGKSGHMTASCKVDKTKLNCTFCKLKGSHNTNTCLKKKKANKTKGNSKERKENKPFLRMILHHQGSRQIIQEEQAQHPSDQGQVHRKLSKIFVSNYD